jgi:hypothetical protein
MQMRTAAWLGTTLLASLTIVGAAEGIVSSAADAVQLSDGRVYFVQPPSLAGAVTTSRTPLAQGATYYFTVSVPENSGEPLQQVVVVQQDGDTSLRRVLFDPEDTRAFVGTPRNRASELTLGEVTFDRETNTVAVTFDPPVPPGTTVTIGLAPERNPRTGGVFLFGVTAFPTGSNAYGQFLGYGRLDFNDPGDGIQFF